MLRIAILTFTFLSFFCASAQRKAITGRVLDKNTGEPIRYAKVYFKGTYSGTATNAKGEFVLNSNSQKASELEFSAVPYESTRMRLSSRSTFPIDILLSKKEISRPFILGQEQIYEIVEGSLESVKRNYYQTNFSATSFHREYVSSFNSIIQTFEGVMTASVSNGTFQNELKDAIYSEDKRQRISFYDPSSRGFYTFGWTELPGDGSPSVDYFLGVRLKEKNDLQNYYTFTFPGAVRDATATTYVINFDQKENIKGALLKGTLYIDSASLAIVKLDYELSPRGKQYVLTNRTIGGVRLCKPPQKLDIVEESGQLNFHKFGNRWHLASHITNTKFNASLDTLTRVKNGEHFLKMRTEKIVTQLDTSFYPSGNAPLMGTMITHNHIKSHFESYQHEKTNWPDYNILKADTSMSSITIALRTNNQIWDRNEGRHAKEALDAETHFKREQLVSDVSYLRKMFIALHPSLREPVHKTHFNRLIGSTERHIGRDLAETEFLRYLSPVIESLHCGHTQLYPSPKTEEYYRKFGKYFPFEVTVMGRRAFLSSDVADTARGAEILKINGTMVSSILQNIRYKASTEGMSNSAKDYFLGKHFADLYASHYLQADSFEIELKDWKTKRAITKTFAAGNYRMEEELTTEYVKAIDSIQTVVLKAPSNISEKEMIAFLNQIFPLINNKRYSNLIIDLRNNNTFKDSFGSLLYSYLSTSPFIYYDRIELSSADSSLLGSLYLSDRKFSEAIPAFVASIVRTDSLVTYSDHANLKKYESNPHTFHGNVYVLVNGGTNSSAADFAKFVQIRKRGQVIGQELHAGAHGSCDAGEIFVVLPATKIRISIPLATYRVNGKITGDSRLIPDHIVQYSITDLIEKKDREMETCRNLIIGNCCSAKSN